MSEVKLLFFLISTVLFYSCSEKPQIHFFCEKDKMDNYIIKWEVFPEKENNKIDIYASYNGCNFGKNPLKTTSINDYVAVLPTTDNIFREFFRLKVGKTYSGIITNRFFNTEYIQNLRDIGGYSTMFNKQVKWGKIYRSGELAHISDKDKLVLDSLYIKTIIDFRSNEQTHMRPDLYAAENYIHIPIEINCFNQEVKSRVLNEAFFKGDAIIYTQDCYRLIIENYTKQYARFLDILCEEENYPVLFHCELGKDRTGLASYFILKALDVLSDSIEKDFLASNHGIDRARLIMEAKELPETMQEVFTMLTMCDISQLKYAIHCMKKKSGSVEEYMAKELKLTHEKKEKLSRILLY